MTLIIVVFKHVAYFEIYKLLICDRFFMFNNHLSTLKTELSDVLVLMMDILISSSSWDIYIGDVYYIKLLRGVAVVRGISDCTRP